MKPDLPAHASDLLAALCRGADPRTANALDQARSRQDARGRWALEYDDTGKTWSGYGSKKQPNKGVNLRALRVLKHAQVSPAPVS